MLAAVTSAARARAASARTGKVAADASKAAAAFAESGTGPIDPRDARGAAPGDAVEPRGEPRPAVR